jgi:lipoprotein-anchoring transpeptidase ErfK/SrfK
MSRLISALQLSISAVVIATSLPSCAVNSGPPPKAEHVLYEWYDDQGPGEVKVKINLNTQLAHFTRGDREIGWSYVATGKEGHGTPSGTYRITEKLEEKFSGSYGWLEDEFGNVTNGDAKPSTKVPPGQKYMAAPMPYWQRITGYGIGMHAGVIPKPGETASHGCIRMPKEFAPVLFSVTKVGTPVTIEH